MALTQAEIQARLAADRKRLEEAGRRRKPQTLAEFLLERIADTITITKAGYSGRWVDNYVLADCEAKRKIVEAYRDALAVYWESYVPEARTEKLSDSAGGHVWTLQWVCKRLAQPYADHDGFREEWRV